MKKILHYSEIIVLAVFLAIAYQLFVINNGFAPAGLNGVATMIQYKTGFSIGYMSIIINVPLCAVAYFLLDKSFAKRSLVFCLAYSIAFLIVQQIGLEEYQYNANGHDTIYPVILSGVISGVVYGVCFKINSSTGGTDIIAKYISHKKPSLNFFWVNFIMNTLVAIASFFVYATEIDGTMVYDYKPVCLCITYSFVSSLLGSYIIQGSKSAYKITIITIHAQQIMEDIKNTIKHSSTKISAIGSFSQEKRDVIICVINRHQIFKISDILQKYDKTFSFLETINDTYGNFKKIK